MTTNTLTMNQFLINIDVSNLIRPIQSSLICPIDNNLIRTIESTVTNSMENNDGITKEEKCLATSDENNNKNETKKSRNKISAADKIRLLEARREGHNPYVIGKFLGIKRNSIGSILRKYDDEYIEKKVGGYKKCLITEEIGDQLFNYIDRNPTSTLSEMVNYLKSCHNLDVSSMTVSRYLKGKCYSYKSVRRSMVEKNCDRVKDLRERYVDRCLTETWSSSQCIYIDETSFNYWMVNKFGWSRKGTRVIDEIPNSQCSKLTLIMAIGVDGPIHYKILTGAVNQEIYQLFISELSSKVTTSQKMYFIHDNASFHRESKTQSQCHELVSLPPYSPFLNPIESVFSSLKSRIRKALTVIPIAERNTRSASIHKIVNELLMSDTYSDLRNYFKHIKKFYPRCIRKEDIHGD